MKELQSRLHTVDFIMTIDLRSGFHLIGMALGHATFTVFKTKFGLCEYLVIPLRLTNALATFERQFHRIFAPQFRIELVIDTKLHIDEAQGMAVVAFIGDILIATKRSLENHCRQVSKVFQLLLDNNMFVGIDICVFDVTETSF